MSFLNATNALERGEFFGPLQRNGYANAATMENYVLGKQASSYVHCLVTLILVCLFFKIETDSLKIESKIKWIRGKIMEANGLLALSLINTHPMVDLLPIHNSF